MNIKYNNYLARLKKHVSGNSEVHSFIFSHTMSVYIVECHELNCQIPWTKSI